MTQQQLTFIEHFRARCGPKSSIWVNLHANFMKLALSLSHITDQETEVYTSAIILPELH